MVPIFLSTFAVSNLSFIILFPRNKNDKRKYNFPLFHPSRPLLRVNIPLTPKPENATRRTITSNLRGKKKAKQHQKWEGGIRGGGGTSERKKKRGGLYIPHNNNRPGVFLYFERSSKCSAALRNRQKVGPGLE